MMNDEKTESDAAQSPHNLIAFGAPGTGKSHLLEEKRKNAVFADYERVTFYPTYSYAQFVGTYKPVMNEKAEIAYAFVPGPFLRMLVKATVSDEKFLLLIEEINRANAAAVFGDMFQLLDRVNGKSEYPIAASEDVKGYLQQELDRRGMTEGFGMKKQNGRWEGACQLSLPSNLYIWATMNSADQGVFPMDTAFKRRWEFEYIGIDDSSFDCDGWKVEGGNTRSKWNDVRSFINGLLSLNGVNEDKLMGPFFVKAEGDLVSESQFESKVLMYLWEDAARMCRSRLFANVQMYSDLVEEWRDKGVEMFKDLMKEGSPASNNKRTAASWKKLFPDR